MSTSPTRRGRAPREDAATRYARGRRITQRTTLALSVACMVTTGAIALGIAQSATSASDQNTTTTIDSGTTDTTSATDPWATDSGNAGTTDSFSSGSVGGSDQQQPADTTSGAS